MKKTTTDQVLARVLHRQDLPRFRRAQLEPRYDRDCLDTFGPLEPNVVSDPERRYGWIEAPVLARVWGILGEDLAQGDTRRLARLLVEFLQIRPDEPADERRGDVVGVSLDHEGVVEEARSGEGEVSELVAQEDACDDGGSGRAESATEWDFIVDLDGEVGRESVDVVASEDVESDAGGQVFVRIKGDLIGALAGVGDEWLEIWGRGRRKGMGNFEGELEREGETDDIEARTDVCRRRWDTDGE